MPSERGYSVPEIVLQPRSPAIESWPRPMYAGYVHAQKELVDRGARDRCERGDAHGERRRARGRERAVGIGAPGDFVS